ncbi:DUF1127 domain-containing protein [Oceanibium sediminis]|uniref:DUF1127 domain-containing protein n=1 Tax=Oceanibium sediminis TaxID=2026339 RepID=UPI0034D4DFF9
MTVSAGLTAVQRKVAAHRTERELAALPDDILRDLGLERGRLRTAARKAANQL